MSLTVTAAGDPQPQLSSVIILLVVLIVVIAVIQVAVVVAPPDRQSVLKPHLATPRPSLRPSNPRYFPSLFPLLMAVIGAIPLYYSKH